MPDLTVPKVLEEAQKHRSFWQARADKFDEWYKLLILDDSEIYQEDMECVISNDPKTFFKKARRILASGISHSIPTDVLASPELVDISSIIKFLNAIWLSKDRAYMRRGRQGWLHELCSFLLASGWYDVLTYGLPADGLIAEIRNPAECFPMFGDEGLISHFHIYSLEGRAAIRKCAVNGWKLEREIRKNSIINLYDYWFIEDNQVYNTIVLGDQLVKEATPINFREIPILCGPVSGMPDRGAILVGDLDWPGRLGESIVSDNAEIYKNYNKQLSFIQQMIRDVAQPKWKEKSGGNTPILNPDTMYKRGAIFRMALDEDVEPAEVPPLPVEMSMHSRELEGMIQRGSFPWTMYGGLAQAITTYTMSQITAAAKEILSPYAETLKYILSEIDNIWISAMLDYGMTVDGWALPQDLPRVLKAKVDVPVAIPGDFIQRATLSRMISPDFKLSSKTTMEMLWPEIKDVDREIAKARADEALNHPVAKTISLISAFRNKVAELQDLGDSDGAELFEKAANLAEATMSAQFGIKEEGGVPQLPAPSPEEMV